MRSSPKDLYSVLELVEKDRGMNPWKHGWAIQAEIRRFKQTANTIAPGDNSRHTASTERPPENPMTVLEARLFIGSIVKSWLEHKGTSSPSAPPAATAASP